MPQTKYPLPAVIDPPGTLHICVPVPDEPGHRTAFLGALTNLSQWTAWQKDPAKTGTAVARVWKLVLDCVLEQMP